MKTAGPSHGAGFLWVFAVLSLASVAIGCLVAAVHGAPAGVWGRDVAAWAIGGVLAIGLARWAGRPALMGFLVAAPLGLILGLWSPGQQGVHRWIDLGPIHMNVAEVLLPATVVALGALAASPAHWLAAAVVMGLLIAQPDASQATAFGGAVLALVALSPIRGVVRVGAMVLVVAAIIAAWGRSDPLAPVSDVEGIMALAWALSPVVGVLAWATLAGAVLAPVLLRDSEARLARPAAALTVYAVGSAVTPLFGAFPVPLVGMGMSPILGLWVGAALLAALGRPSRPAPPP